MTGITPIEIDVPAYLHDHRVGQMAVLPAVEAMRILALRVRQALPQMHTRRILTAEFLRFVPLPENGSAVAAGVELARDSDQEVTARLLTRIRSKTGKMVRWVPHVQIRFSAAVFSETELPEPPVLETAFACDADRVYDDLVPFGPAYRNLVGTVALGPDGVIASVRATPDQIVLDNDPVLGSPFALDAAFHTACVWGQRYGGQVIYPTGFEQRAIYRPTTTGETYAARTFVSGQDRKGWTFNLALYDDSGRCCERLQGLRMQDISGGRSRPPRWIRR